MNGISRTMTRVEAPWTRSAHATTAVERQTRKMVDWDDLPEPVQAAINRARNNSTRWDYYARYGNGGEAVGYTAVGKSQDPVDLSTTYFTIQVDPRGRVQSIEQTSSGPIFL